MQAARSTSDPSRFLLQFRHPQRDDTPQGPARRRARAGRAPVQKPPPEHGRLLRELHRLQAANAQLLEQRAWFDFDFTPVPRLHLLRSPPVDATHIVDASERLYAAADTFLHRPPYTFVLCPEPGLADRARGHSA